MCVCVCVCVHGGVTVYAYVCAVSNFLALCFTQLVIFPVTRSRAETLPYTRLSDGERMMHFYRRFTGPQVVSPNSWTLFPRMR